MISNAELRDIIADEKWAILKPKIDLAQAELKIEELQMQLDCPDYYDDRTSISPSLHSQLNETKLVADNADKLIQELDSIHAFGMGMLIATYSPMFIILCVLLWATWNI
tara:strand:- start:141 stop:467 length:327 start_codon:yes stop_codon:yes gene_type:complete